MTLHSPSFSSRVFLCVCHAAVSLIPNWKEEHEQIKAKKKTREKPICGCFFVCCDIDQLKIEIRHSTSWYLKSTNEKSEFAPSVLTENLIWREKQLKVTSIVFWKNAKSKLAFGKNFSEYAKLWRDSDWRFKKRCVKLHKNWKKADLANVNYRDIDKIKEQVQWKFFFRSLTILAPKTSRKCLTI